MFCVQNNPRPFLKMLDQPFTCILYFLPIRLCGYTSTRQCTSKYPPPPYLTPPARSSSSSSGEQIGLAAGGEYECGGGRRGVVGGRGRAVKTWG